VNPRRDARADDRYKWVALANTTASVFMSMLKPPGPGGWNGMARNGPPTAMYFRGGQRRAEILCDSVS
jgi:hypothetical protein